MLKDTINGCLCIASRGNPEGDYPLYKDGISRIRNHILGGKFSGEIAGAYASKVLYLAASMLTGLEEVKKIADAAEYSGMVPDIETARRFSYLRVVDPIAYGYFIEAMLLLKDTELT